MTRISSGLLSDTLNVVQLARETAIQQGKQTQAKRLSPVVDEMRNLVNTSRQTQAPAKATGMLAGDDFQALLAASQSNQAPKVASNNPVTAASSTASTGASSAVRSVQSTPYASQASPLQASSAAERNRVIVAMSGGNMSEIDIARQMGMTREEVRLVMNVNQRAMASSGSSSTGNSTTGSVNSGGSK